MGDHTHIEWTDATWNPITGCSVVSPGCKHCYAMKLAGGRLQHHPSRTGLTIDTATGPVWNGEVRFNPGWLHQPMSWRKPRRIFVCAHGDLFHEAVPDAWIDMIFAVMALSPQHSFQVLTKRADRMQQYVTGATFGRMLSRFGSSPPDHLFNISRHEMQVRLTGEPEAARRFYCPQPAWPLPNVWLGVSVEDQQRANERIPLLLGTPAAIRWISAEPLLGRVDLCEHLGMWWNPTMGCFEGTGQRFNPRNLDWVIAGGESGPNARPMHPDWVRSLRDQCAAAGVPFLFKQWGEWLPCITDERDAGTPAVVLGPGYGLHFFIADRWLFWFYKTQLDSSGSECIKEQIELFCLGRNKARIERVIERFKPKPPPRNGMDVYRFGEFGWGRAASIAKRPLDSVFVTGGAMQRITKQIEDFIDRRDWYLTNGLPHKLTILLHGVPGCGKTSLIKALAGHYGFDIYSLNINEMTDKTFSTAISAMPKRAFLLIEDFDSASAVKARAVSSPTKPKTEGDAIAEAVADFAPLSLTGVLNALDGIVPLDNHVVFMTTNRIEAIDAAVLRKGRTDLIVEIGPLGPPEIAAFITRVYGVRPARAYPTMPGCDLQALVLEHKTDYRSFIQDLDRLASPRTEHTVYQEMTI